MNSAAIAPLLSTMQPPPPPLLRCLETSLTAAAQMLVSLSTDGAHVWRLASQDPASFPSHAFQVDRAAVQQLCYAVDSTWISHTFAVTFLVLCYTRGVIDDNLQISSPSLIIPPETSLIARLLRLARDIFDAVCEATRLHPARGFCAIVRDATALVLAPDESEVDELALQAVLDLVNEGGFEWPMVEWE
ncbi:hypothetical protein ASPZODRAFT_1961849 [Penicilliopsis zonata CBS 506.65]|uniref:Uncharacterized protein n=1 Tax=Penicilliopsis zonata CBS 506.65 TaxID=1073090 RepID=A0A1L9SGR6_9EURO|nr:hypothetical protein ASPZODRAFT_1961849 [Penicilliopsis zonata CBS 506.65]OJJ46430.1 hypothetical protein ASPZODRAFT_1961849 [Penicilliopsis zonata CBS 506.65]